MTGAEVIGSGDDGVLLKNGEVAIKTFKKNFPNNKDGTTNILNEIAKDKAERELNALKLLKGHPNFPTLISTSVDTNTEVFAVRMAHVANLRQINHPLTPTMSGELYEHTVRNIIGQMFDVLITFKTLNIRHRDLDSGNVKLIERHNTICVMDFSRADVPNMTPINEKIFKAMNTLVPPDDFEPDNIDRDRKYLRQQIRDGDIVKNEYSMPCILNKDCVSEPTDYDMMRRLALNRLHVPRGTSETPRHQVEAYISETFEQQADAYMDWVWPWKLSDSVDFFTDTKKNVEKISFSEHWLTGDATEENIKTQIEKIHQASQNQLIFNDEELYYLSSYIQDPINLSKVKKYSNEICHRAKTYRYPGDDLKTNVARSCIELDRLVYRLAAETKAE